MDFEPLAGIFATIFTIIFAAYKGLQKVYGKYTRQRDAIEALSQKQTATDETTKKQAEELAALKATETRNTETINRLQESLTSKDATIEQLQASNRLQLEEMAVLKEQMKKLEIDVEVLRRDKEKLKTELKKTTEQLNAQKQRNMGMKDALEILGKQISALNIEKEIIHVEE
jgi:chromosome segregation ATPase